MTELDKVVIYKSLNTDETDSWRLQVHIIRISKNQKKFDYYDQKYME